MAETQIAQIQMRRDTAANWTSEDPTLESGEWGLETDTKKIKIGDGSTAWSSLDYFRYDKDRICTAWVAFTGSGTVAIRDSYNVTSITDNDIGDYTINFTNAMDNVNYCVVGLGSGEDGSQEGLVIPWTQTTSSVRIGLQNDGSAKTDRSLVNVVIFGGVD